MSAASFVYTKLGLEELESWTALKKQFSKVRRVMDANPDTFEQHVDELTALGRKIAEIEQRAEVPEDMRSA